MDQLIGFYKRVKSPPSTGDGCVSPNRPIILLFFSFFFFLYIFSFRKSKQSSKPLKNTHKFKGFFFFLFFFIKVKSLKSNATWVL